MALWPIGMSVALSTNIDVGPKERMRNVLPMLTAFALLFHVSALADEVGERVATKGNGQGSTPCVACHGAQGEGNSAAGFPRIAGMNADYLATQVLLIRDGVRVSPVMASGLKGLTDDQAKAASGYFSSLPGVAVAVEPPSDAAREVAERLAKVGDWPGRDLPSCESCHGPAAQGVSAIFPGIAGQHAPYIQAQLKAFRDGTRDTDPGGLMRTVAKKLDDAEIAALGAWLASQPQRGAK
ncbi:MAG: cytochrome c553 [Kiritimatiellia bacterium]|jgi:cytochrome c553